jgi:hypothetical protein
VPGMTPDEVVDELLGEFAGLAPRASWGETSLFYNPDGALPSGVYFCTIKEQDGANDAASRLDRSGVFRVALGLPRHRYEERFGPRPPRPAKGGVVATGHDFTELDALMPHPVYAWMGWVQVLSPSPRTFADLRPLFAEAYDAVVAKYPSLLTKRARRS